MSPDVTNCPLGAESPLIENSWSSVNKPRGHAPWVLWLFILKILSRCNKSGWPPPFKGSFSHLFLLSVSTAPQVQWESTVVTRHAQHCPFFLTSPCITVKTSGILDCRFSSLGRDSPRKVTVDARSHLVSWMLNRGGSPCLEVCLGSCVLIS